MKAIVFEKVHSRGALQLREVDRPVPGAGEVLVKIHSVAVNAADYRSMRLGILPKSGIYGADVAGRVEAVGSNVAKFRVGDDVFGDLSGCGFGGLAEYAAAPESALALKPAGVSYAEAAAVSMAAVTALQGLRDCGHVQPGQQVLIYGAGGGVGNFAVQLARHFGARVTAVCSSRNAELARTLGAERVIDYAREDFAQNGRRYDLILAVNGSRPLGVFRRALAPGGSLVVVGGALAQVIQSMLFGPLLSLGSRKVRTLAAKPNARDLEFIIGLVEAGGLKAVIDRQYPLRQTAEAMAYLSQGHARGKVIIDVAADDAQDEEGVTPV